MSVGFHILTADAILIKLFSNMASGLIILAPIKFPKKKRNEMFLINLAIFTIKTFFYEVIYKSRTMYLPITKTTKE